MTEKVLRPVQMIRLDALLEPDHDVLLLARLFSMYL